MDRRKTVPFISLAPKGVSNMPGNLPVQNSRGPKGFGLCKPSKRNNSSHR